MKDLTEYLTKDLTEASAKDGELSTLLTRRAAVALLAGGISLAGGLSFLPRLGADPAAESLVVGPGSSQGAWQGWGCSLAWWAGVFGDRDDIADLLFTTKSTALNGETLPGLGLTVARYNAGGSSAGSVEGSVMHASPHIPAFRQMQGYWLDPHRPDPASGGWDWTTDENQRLMLQKARDRGASHFELFSNSPMWWMCRNLDPSGADAGSEDNLQPSCLRLHAVYLATIAKHAADYWGIIFDAVEAFNEPSATWWYSHANQEGCHFDAKAQAAVVPALRKELDRRGLTKTKVAASDENNYDEALRTWNSFSGPVKAQVGRVNVHGYQFNPISAKSKSARSTPSISCWPTIRATSGPAWQF